METRSSMHSDAQRAGPSSLHQTGDAWGGMSGGATVGTCSCMHSHIAHCTSHMLPSFLTEDDGGLTTTRANDANGNKSGKRSITRKLSKMFQRSKSGGTPSADCTSGCASYASPAQAYSTHVHTNPHPTAPHSGADVSTATPSPAHTPTRGTAGPYDQPPEQYTPPEYHPTSHHFVTPSTGERAAASPSPDTSERRAAAAAAEEDAILQRVLEVGGDGEDWYLMLMIVPITCIKPWLLVISGAHK